LYIVVNVANTSSWTP